MEYPALGYSSTEFRIEQIGSSTYDMCMNVKHLLEISLAWGERQPATGSQALAVYRGGASTLLRWLETQLGLHPVNQPRLERVAAIRAALLDNLRPSFEVSFSVDPWATAAELLDRVDELRMAGWRGEQLEGAPPLVDDLAPVYSAASGGEPDRLERVLEALENGQHLPAHRCVLYEEPGTWPRLWQRVLKYLEIEESQEIVPAGPEGSALRQVQESISSEGPAPTDRSLVQMQAGSATAAIEIVAAILERAPEKLATTVVCSPRPEWLLRLDGALRRRGLPRGGAASEFNRHPVLEVLPLVIGMTWDPIDPVRAMDLLSLQGGPVPRELSRGLPDGPKARRGLAWALNEMPGIGSRTWEEVVNGFDRDDPAVARTLSIFSDSGVKRGETVPPNVLVERCRLIGTWARARGAVMDEDDEGRPWYQAAAVQAEALAETLAAIEAPLSEGQISRLLELCDDMAPRASAVPETGGPIFVTTPGGIEPGCRQVVWLGLGPASSLRCRWTRDDLARLAQAGLEVDDGTRRVAAGVAADRRGLAQVEECLLAVDVIGGDGAPPHPLWQEVVSKLEPVKPSFIEATSERNDHKDGEWWAAPLVEVTLSAPIPSPSEWVVPADLLSERDNISASELEIRIGCPLAWVFRYNAYLQYGTLQPLPSELLITGNFLHQIMAEVFSEKVPPSPDEAASRAKALFDERVALDAVPLSIESKALTREQVRDQITGAARLLAEILARGDYRMVGMEFRPEGRLLGRKITGAIDCLVQRSDGSEAVIDFKYGNKDKYPKWIEKGSSVQLATYAAMRRQETGSWPAIAYLMLNYGFMVTPCGGAVAGAQGPEILDGKGAAAVWREVSEALELGDYWLNTGVIPVRPLQDPGYRTKNTSTFIDEPSRGKKRESLRPCSYCDFKPLCGVGRPV